MFEPKTHAEKLLWAAVNKMANMQRSDTTRLDDLGALDAIDRNFDELRQTARRAVEQVNELSAREWPKEQLYVTIIDRTGKKYSETHRLAILDKAWMDRDIGNEMQQLVDMFQNCLNAMNRERHRHGTD